jgi:hypothetical protein
MPRVGFEPTIPVFERAKTIHALDRAVTDIGCGFAWVWVILARRHQHNATMDLMTLISPFDNHN